MSLDSTEKVYQSDLMHITPKADADIYGLKGDWVLRGLEMDIGTGQVALHPGSALLQGRLYELSQLKTISTAGLTGNYWVGLNADLSQVNSTNGTFTNNQFTMTTNTTGAFGDLRNGDIQAFIPLYQISGGVMHRVVFPYHEKTTITAEPYFVGWDMSRTGKLVSVAMFASTHSAIANGQVIAHCPESMIPDSLAIISAYNGHDSYPQGLLFTKTGDIRWQGMGVPSNFQIIGNMTYVTK